MSEHQPVGDGDAVPEPPWRQTGRRRQTSPRTTLTRGTIVEAALQVLDRDGLDGLTMRAVAAELGTGPGAIYWHVVNKEQLLQLVIDRVSGEIELPEPDPERWQEQLKDMARAMRRNMASHRDLARASFGRIPIGTNTVRFVEWILAVLRPAGVPDRAAALAGDLLALYVGAFAFEESLPFPSPTDEDTSLHEFVSMIRDYFASLPPERFPNTVALADDLVAGGPDERFDFGLEIIIQGLAAQAATGAAGRPGGKDRRRGKPSRSLRPAR